MMPQTHKRLATAVLLLLVSGATFAQDLPDAPSHTIDKKFLFLNLAGDTAMLVDYGYTRLNVDAGYRERNPLLGERPGSPRLIAVGAAWSAGLWASSYYLKKRHNRLWFVPRLGQAAVNAYFAYEGSKNSRARYVCTDYSTGGRTCVPR